MQSRILIVRDSVISTARMRTFPENEKSITFDEYVNILNLK